MAPQQVATGRIDRDIAVRKRAGRKPQLIPVTLRIVGGTTNINYRVFLEFAAGLLAVSPLNTQGRQEGFAVELLLTRLPYACAETSVGSHTIF